MSYQAEAAGRSGAGIGGLVRLLIIIGAPLAGFLAASGFEHCGPRLLSMAGGLALVAPAAGTVLVRTMRFDALGATVFIIAAAIFVYFAGPMMDQCRPGF